MIPRYKKSYTALFDFSHGVYVFKSTFSKFIGMFPKPTFSKFIGMF